jgi:hypothetical protein
MELFHTKDDGKSFMIDRGVLFFGIRQCAGSVSDWTLPAVDLV